ncbi:MAG TPA: hypothetical protein VFM97_04775 [Gammaproteobacteria bacterium]|nr:hypothetical protein [Gammaproteobacteria bacterium]
MAEQPTVQYFRTRNRMYPWLVAAAVLFAGAYMLAMFTKFPAWAVLAFVAGLAIGGLGVKYVRQPAARLTDRAIALSDPRGLALGMQVYSLKQVKRVAVITDSQGAANKLQRGVLMVNLTGVPPERVEDFVREIRARNINIG